jgi:hypothetical protein
MAVMLSTLSTFPKFNINELSFVSLSELIELKEEAHE